MKASDMIYIFIASININFTENALLIEYMQNIRTIYSIEYNNRILFLFLSLSSSVVSN